MTLKYKNLAEKNPNFKYHTRENYQIQPDIFSQVDFNKPKTIDGQTLQLDKESKSSKKYILTVKAPVTHSMRRTLNNALYLPSFTDASSKNLYTPYPKPILREHHTGGDSGFSASKPETPLGRIYMANYTDFNKHADLYNAKNFSKEKSFSVLQDYMKRGDIYTREFEGAGAIIMGARIVDQEAIDQFLSEQLMTFSVGFTSDNIFSPFNGKSILDLEEDEPGPWDEVDGMRGFKVMGNMFYNEASVASCPADDLAIVNEMELGIVEGKDSAYRSEDFLKERGIYELNSYNYKQEEILVEDKVTKEQPNNIGDINMTYKAKDFCGPNNTFPVTNLEEAKSALAELETCELEDSAKALVKKNINSKIKQYEAETKKALLNGEGLEDKVAKSSYFDLASYCVSLKDALTKNNISEEEILELFDITDAKSKSEQLRVLDSELKQKRSELVAQSAELEKVIAERDASRENFVVLAKAVVDNKARADIEKVEKTQLASVYDSLVTSEDLESKIAKIIEGLSPEKDKEGEVQNPVKNTDRSSDQNLGKGELDGELEKQISVTYKDKIAEDGKFKADSWLKRIHDQGILTEDSYKKILIKE